MEIIGTNSEGKVLRAPFKKFAEDNAEEGEVFRGVGSTAAHAKYQRQDGTYREVDLRELAAQGGIIAPKFSFNLESAKAQGLTNEEKNIDQGVVYNLGRLKTDQAKRAYLQEKGYKSFFNSGDDYYQVTEGGYIKPINNKEGLDLSDFTRLATTAGRDAGAMAATALTVGATAIAPPALAMAGAAGAVGATVGEGVQRFADKVFGADADKYNAQISGAEEGIEALKTAGTGVLQGVLGQGVNRLFSAAQVGASNVAANTLKNTKYGEIVSRYAARSEASALESRLPPAALSGFRSTEEAVIAEALKNSQGKDVATETVKNVVSAAKKVMYPAKGSLKPSAEEARAVMENKALYMKVLQEQAVSKEAASSAVALEEMENAAKPELQAIFKRRHIENAKEVLGSKADEIFREGGDLAAAEKAVSDVERMAINRVESILKIKPQMDSGHFIGIPQNELDAKVTKLMEQKVKAIGSDADKSVAIGFSFKEYPDEYMKAGLAAEIDTAIDMVEKGAFSMAGDNKQRLTNAFSYLKTALDNHGPMTSADDAAYAYRKFLEEARTVTSGDMFSPGAHDAVRHVSNALFAFAEPLSAIPNMAVRGRQMHMAAMDAATVMRKEIHGQDGGIDLLLGQFRKITSKMGDEAGDEVSSIAYVYNINSALSGTKNPQAWAHMTEADRKSTYALQAARNFRELGVKKIRKYDNPAVDLAGKFVGGSGSILKTAGNALLGAANVAPKIAAKAAKMPKFTRSAAQYGIPGAEESMVRLIQSRGRDTSTELGDE